MGIAEKAFQDLFVNFALGVNYTAPGSPVITIASGVGKPMSKDNDPITRAVVAAAETHPPVIQVATLDLSELGHPQGIRPAQGEAPQTVSLVMATARVYDHKQPIPLRVFYDRAKADGWLESLIDYHLRAPDLPIELDSDEAWVEYHDQVKAWRAGHPAGPAAAEYQHFGVYDLPLEL